MRRSGNREENKRIIMDLDVVLKSHDCPYIVQCLGAIITNVSIIFCFLSKLIYPHQEISENFPQISYNALKTLKPWAWSAKARNIWPVIDACCLYSPSHVTVENEKFASFYQFLGYCYKCGTYQWFQYVISFHSSSWQFWRMIQESQKRASCLSALMT